MSLWKIPFLLSIAYGFQRVLHPPNVVKKEGHKRFTDLWTRDFIAWGQFGGKVGPSVCLFPPFRVFRLPSNLCTILRSPHHILDPTIP